MTTSEGLVGLESERSADITTCEAAYTSSYSSLLVIAATQEQQYALESGGFSPCLQPMMTTNRDLPRSSIAAEVARWGLKKEKKGVTHEERSSDSATFIITPREMLAKGGSKKCRRKGREWAQM